MFSREQSACTVSFFSMRKLRSRLSLFSREEGQPSASHGSRPTVAEAWRGLKSWGSQAELADELERGLDDDDEAISLTSFDPAASALLGYAQEEQEMSEGEEAEAEPAQSSCPAYDELLEVMERATARLDLPWKRAKMAARGKKLFFFFLKPVFLSHPWVSAYQLC